MEKIDKQVMEAWLYGSIILGGGGGGSLEIGRQTIEAAYAIGTPSIVKVEELDGADGCIVTTSAVGAPAAKDQFVKPEDYNRIMELMENELGAPPLAFITNELGGGSTFNAFIQSATTGAPMLDAACNGRAHPLGTMGSMGLSENAEYTAVQTSAGGNPDTGHYVEITATGSVQKTSALVRTAAVQAGGLVVVARNPVSLEYVEQHAAIGALSHAQQVGEAYLSGNTSAEKIQLAAEALNGSVVCSGKIEQFELTTKNGLDVGQFDLASEGDHYRMHIWNEYMAFEKNGERIQTFPDLLMTFDAESGEPLTSAEISDGQEVVILAVPYKELLLGAGMYEKSGYEAIEEVLGIEMLPYVEPLFARDAVNV